MYKTGSRRSVTKSIFEGDVIKKGGAYLETTALREFKMISKLVACSTHNINIKINF